VGRGGLGGKIELKSRARVFRLLGVIDRSERIDQLKTIRDQAMKLGHREIQIRAQRKIGQ
jgi:hypothetical protein